MNEAEASESVRRLVGNNRYVRLSRLRDLVIAENDRQNLIARSTVGHIWSRHILDSIQLLDLVDAQDGLWADVGTGGGFPGLAIAAVVERPVALIEPRRRRATFLTDAAAALGLGNVMVHPVRIEACALSATTISARAVAPPEKLLQAARHCATPATQWLFPRGVLADGEMVVLERAHPDLMFHVEQSRTDPFASIIVARARAAQ